MYKIIIYMIISLWCTPNIKILKEDKSSMAIEIFYKQEKRGYINIQKDILKFYLSFGFKSCKGIMKIEDVDFFYKENILSLRNHKDINKNILTLKCSESNYNLLNDFIIRLKE